MHTNIFNAISPEELATIVVQVLGSIEQILMSVKMFSVLINMTSYVIKNDLKLARILIESYNVKDWDNLHFDL